MNTTLIEQHLENIKNLKEVINRYEDQLTLTKSFQLLKIEETIENEKWNDVFKNQERFKIRSNLKSRRIKLI